MILVVEYNLKRFSAIYVLKKIKGICFELLRIDKTKDKQSSTFKSSLIAMFASLMID